MFGFLIAIALVVFDATKNEGLLRKALVSLTIGGVEYFKSLTSKKEDKEE